MFKNQLQELAQRSCFNLPSYRCVREGPDHAPRFKARVNFNGEIFDSPKYCNTLRQAEHSAAEVALTALSATAPSRSLTSRVLVSFFLPFPFPFPFHHLLLTFLARFDFYFCYRMRQECIRTSFRRHPTELVLIFQYTPP